MSAFFRQRRGGASEKYCSRETDIMVDRRRNTSIHVSCDASPLDLFQGKREKKKKGAAADEWPRSQRRVSLKGLRGEDDYFLAKWFWLELRLNPV